MALSRIESLYSTRVLYCTVAVHIHVDATPHTAQSLTNLAKMVYRNEDLLFQAIGTSSERKARYTKPMEQEFIDRLAQSKPDTMNELNRPSMERQITARNITTSLDTMVSITTTSQLDSYKMSAGISRHH